MSIVGTSDNRRIINRFDSPEDITKEPLPSITAIDTRFISDIESFNAYGTGIVISPNYVLTAAHVLYAKGEISDFQNRIRVSSSNQQKSFNDRQLNPIFMDPNDNVDTPAGIFLPFEDKFIGAPAGSPEENNFDIGLIKLNDTGLISDAPPVGLIAFVDPLSLEGSFRLPIQTAGYPVDNVAGTYPDNGRDNKGILDRDEDENNIRTPAELDNLDDFSVRARDLVLAPGTLDANGNEITGIVERAGRKEGERRILYSERIDTVPGQSGSPVWSVIPEEDDGVEPIPRVLAVHSRGGDALNAVTLIDTEAYKLIVDEIEENGDPNELPENAIIGSDPRIDITPKNDGNDLVEGTYRKELILGLTGDDTIFGGGANDRLEGEDGDDDLDGGPGDDRLTGGRGNDKIDGGTNSLAIINPFNRENDVAVYFFDRSEYKIETETIGGIGIIGIGEETVTTVTHLNGNGFDGTDTLTNIEILEFADVAIPLASGDDLDDLLNFFGGDDDDVIVGNALANRILGEAGNDRLEGDDGDDTLKGHDGNDSLFGEGDDDLLQGSFGNDSLEGGAGRDRMYGNEGSDIFRGGDGNDILSGGAGYGKDTLKGQGGDDSIAGGGGDDLLQGGDDEDTLKGNGGADRLFGDNGNDLVEGGTGNDLLHGWNGDDTLKGEAGDDYFDAHGGNDFVYGDIGNDEMYGGAGFDCLYGNEGNDSIQGGNNNDRLFGQDGNDTIRGNNGRDYMQGNRNDDILKGGWGRDTLIGGGEDDLLQGEGGSDLLYGQDGDDRLYGGLGNDVLFGNSGQNTMNGGDGSDRFVFNNSDQSIGEITDFTVEDDTMVFKVNNFAGISTKGMISSDMLQIGTGANDSSDRFIYNSSTGNLFYDSDGSRSKQKVKLVGLDTGLALTNSDFEMI